jgi:hypothetical protein
MEPQSASSSATPSSWLVDRIVFGTGTVIARQAHAHLRHGGLFEACRRCNAFGWAPAEDQGVLVTAANGQPVEGSDLARRLLVP